MSIIKGFEIFNLWARCLHFIFENCSLPRNQNHCLWWRLLYFLAEFIHICLVGGTWYLSPGFFPISNYVHIIISSTQTLCYTMYIMCNPWLPILQDAVLTSQPVFPRAVPGDGSHVWRSRHNTSQSEHCSFPHLFITLTLSTAGESSSENTPPNI